MARRRAVAALAALVTSLAVLLAPSASAAQPQSPEPESWILVDATSGKVLAAKDPHTARPPASTAKLMTALTAVERVAPGSPVKVSQLAASQPASRINMAVGQEWPFEDALAALMMVSANDAAYAIAETTSGSLDGFQAALTSTAARYGMKDSTFADPAGLDDSSSFGGGPRMSAFDIAISARNTLAVPQLAFLAALEEHDITDPTGAARHLVNHNKMLPGNSVAYAGATGLKTGYTSQAGHTLVATATRDGRSLIVVVLNTYDTYGWAATLLDQGFATAPDDPGTGEKLPPVRVSPFAQREADFVSFTRLATGADPVGIASAPLAATASSGPGTGTTVTTPTTTLTTVAAPGAGEKAAVAQGSADGEPLSSDTPRSSDGGSHLVRNLLIVLLVLLVVVVQLRRRAVKRQRARRIARRHATTKAMHRGSLPVVDGRYRNGAGRPATASHVRVEPLLSKRPRGPGER